MPLMDAGLNSLSATQLALQLERQTGVALPPTLIFQYSTAGAIAEHLQTKLAPVSRERHPSASIQDHAEHTRNVQMTSTAGRWPGGAACDGELARLADTTYDAVSEVPASRWLASNDVRHPAVRFAAHTPNAELFDCSCFSISAAEVSWCCWLL